jgi:hypothetical protein
MEKSNKRGKIPQTDWPLIMARYEAGETLASIARTYDCSPPAISYIVGRNRDKPANETPSLPTLEPQLIKAHPNGSSANGSIAVVEPKVAPAAAPVTAAPLAETMPPRNGAAPSPVSPMATVQPVPAHNGNGEQRQKLHLGFGNANNHTNGHSNGSGNSVQQPQAQPRPNPFDNGHSNRDFAAARDVRPSQIAPQTPPDDAPPRKERGTALDQELRSRIDGDLTAFLAAFDAVLAADTQESRFGLKEATDRLLRVGARTRIELERLEARVPLGPSGHAEPAGWRYR